MGRRKGWRRVGEVKGNGMVGEGEGNEMVGEGREKERGRSIRFIGSVDKGFDLVASWLI